jgi:uncharacterized protein YfaQ (DUF2300 family)
MKAKQSSKQRLVKVPVQAYLEPAQAADLKALSESTRVPAQAYIREGVETVLAKYKKVKVQKGATK